MIVDKLAKLNRSSRSALLAALTVISTIAMYRWTVAPHATYLYAAQQYESVIDRMARKNDVIGRVIESKKKKLTELREQFARLHSTLFSPDEAKEFFSDLQVISDETGCVIYSLNFITSRPGLKPKQPKDTSGIASKSAMLNVGGVYGDIIKLVERLQKRGQKVWIDSLKMEGLDDGSDRVRCDITITIYTVEDKEATVNA
jgi:hypothetical protein